MVQGLLDIDRTDLKTMVHGNGDARDSYKWMP